MSVIKQSKGIPQAARAFNTLKLFAEDHPMSPSGDSKEILPRQIVLMIEGFFNTHYNVYATSEDAGDDDVYDFFEDLLSTLMHKYNISPTSL